MGGLPASLSPLKSHFGCRTNLDRTHSIKMNNDEIIRRMRNRIRRDILEERRDQGEELRKEVLEDLFREDLKNDREALRSDSPDSFKLPPMFTSYSMDGKRGYILEDLSTYARELVKIQQYYDIRQLIDDEEWLTDVTEGWGDDIINHDFNEGARLVHEIYENESFMYKHSDPRLWREIALASRFLDKIRVVRRLLDLRNRGLDMDSEPQPDGQNIEDRHLRIAWVLHRACIRALHYRSLSFGTRDFGFEQIKKILLLDTVFLAFEVNDHGFEPWDEQQNDDMFKFFVPMYAQVLTVLQNIGRDLMIERRTPANGVTYTYEQTVAYNIAPERFSPLLRSHFDPIGTQWRFYSDLWERSSNFETAHGAEHVEDHLINKRIVYGDERAQLIEALKDPDWIPANIADLPAISGDDLNPNGVSLILGKISEVNRLRQSYLVLRDWMKRRPWKQLYYVCDTKEGAGSEQIPHIAEFHDKLEALKVEYPMPPDEHIPTNRANMYSCLFPIHPLAITNLPDSMAGNACAICQDDFEESANQIIVVLHCNHILHYLCVRNYWDGTETRYGTKCPICRSRGKEMSLPDVAGIQVECLDVWDYERIHPLPAGVRGAEDLSIFSDTYKGLEGRNLNESYMYDLLVQDGYREKVNAEKTYVREPEVEMSVVRWARRKNNEQRRNLIAHLGQSVHSLDPGFKRPPKGRQGLNMAQRGPRVDPNFQPSAPIDSDSELERLEGQTADNENDDEEMEEDGDEEMGEDGDQEMGDGGEEMEVDP